MVESAVSRPYSVDEAARRIGISRQTLYALIRAGKFPALTIPGTTGKPMYRVLQSDLEQYASGCRVVPIPPEIASRLEAQIGRASCRERVSSPV
mgnify:CR=1 FL=1